MAEFLFKYFSFKLLVTSTYTISLMNNKHLQGGFVIVIHQSLKLLNKF